MKLRGNIPIAIVVLSSIFLSGCCSQPDYEALRSDILELHRKNIQAHLNKDVDFFVNNLSDDFMSVSGGEIYFPTKEEISSNFSSYLNSTEFSQYTDLREPIIGFSKDGSVAWSVVQVRVAGKQTADDGIEKDMDFTCAWITLYQREGRRWIKLAEVSNFR